MKTKKLIYIGNKLSQGNPTTMNSLISLFELNGNKVHSYGSSKNKFLRLIGMLFGIIRHRKADFLLIDTYSTSNFYYAFLGSQLARVLGLKYINILHGGNLPDRLKKNPKLSKCIFQNSYALVAPSNYLKQSFEEEGYEVQIIPNPITIGNYSFDKKEFDYPRILWVRAFQELYNPEMAIHTFKVVKTKYSKATLTMIGPDKDGSLERCKELAKELGVLSDIDFTGFQTKEQWISTSKDCNVFLNTTNYDNTPVSVLEAMALGLPVISTNVGGMPFVIRDEESGIIVNKNDHEAMAKAVFESFQDISKTENLANAARVKVEKSDSKCVGELWNKLLEDVL